jgi:hypothetical protein
MSLTPPLPDPQRFVRDFRANYVNFHNLWRQVDAQPSGIRLETPAQRPLSTEDVPDGARTLLADWSRRHPGYRIDLYKYLRAVDGDVVEVIEDERGLPEEHEFITLSQTATLATAAALHVVTEMLVGRLIAAPQEAAE